VLPATSSAEASEQLQRLYSLENVIVFANRSTKVLITATLGKNWMPERVSIVKENLVNENIDNCIFPIEISHRLL